MNPPHPLPSIFPLLLPMAIQLLQLVLKKETNVQLAEPIFCMILAGVSQTGVWVTFLNPKLRAEPAPPCPPTTGAGERKVQEGIGLRERPGRLVLKARGRIQNVREVCFGRRSQGCGLWFAERATCDTNIFWNVLLTNCVPFLFLP